MRLSAAQLGQFKRDGLLELPGFFSAAQVAAWKRQMDEHMVALQREHGAGGPPGIPLHGIEPPVASATWPTHPTDFPLFFMQPHPGDTDALRGLIEQVGGPDMREGRPQRGAAWYGDVRGVFPEPAGTEWRPPPHAAGHIDGYGGANSWRGGFLLGATFYLNDVPSKAGCLCVWPRSHAAVHRYFQAHEGSIDGRYICDPDWVDGGWGKMYAHDDEVLPMREFAAKAGTLLLWHGWMVHGASPNCGSEPRLAVHLRFNNQSMRGELVRHGQSGLAGDPGPGRLDASAPTIEEQRTQLRCVVACLLRTYVFFRTHNSAACSLLRLINRRKNRPDPMEANGYNLAGWLAESGTRSGWRTTLGSSGGESSQTQQSLRWATRACSRVSDRTTCACVRAWVRACVRCCAVLCTAVLCWRDIQLRTNGNQM
jgi:hypothetical protein